ncbi:Candidate zinc-binding lipoprotein ZinT [Streptococcus agalactiae]|uniref:Candidate zinc-binding lipoprotein ZinT n=1 Tax=Streptococcus agalactiae TaxID=1311 RepID=A0A8B4RAN3_STRAG|nr:Candidate zinc-binding lipoprotein ZinT [Streptococcus agalactiae]
MTDYSGNWQSVYPLLQDGTLDPVWDYKAKSKKDMTAAEYKKYYTAGYKTDVESIKIDGKKHQMTFVRNGKSQTFTYKYAGYKILTYKKVIVEYVISLKLRKKMLVNSNISNLVTMVLNRIKLNTSISSGVQKAKKNYLRKWKTGQHTSQLKCLDVKLPKTLCLINI